MLPHLADEQLRTWVADAAAAAALLAARCEIRGVRGRRGDHVTHERARMRVALEGRAWDGDDDVA